MNGELAAWPKAASDTKAEGGEYLAGPIFFPNSWSGPKDLSVRLRLAHDGQKLYVGLEVTDNVLEEKDGCSFLLSKGGYMDWRAQQVKGDFNWLVGAPHNQDKIEGKSGVFQYVCRRTAAGYVVEGSAALADLGTSPGKSMGIRVKVADGDKTANLCKHAWARKMELLLPNRLMFTYWEDARNCAQMVLE
jgi:hypothetical protein